MRIALFPGHVGKDSGAVSGVDRSVGDTLHTIEACITDSITRKIARHLCDVGIDSVLAIGDFNSRIDATAGCDLGVSIHADWCTDRAVSGYHCIHYGSPAGERLAVCLDTCMNVVSKRARMPHTRKDLAILRRTAFPVTLIEVGFLSNKEEEYAMLLEHWQYRCATMIAVAIMRYVYNGDSGPRG